MSEKRLRRPKKITKEKFEAIRRREWLPLKLPEDARYPWMKNIPLGSEIYVSGTYHPNFNPRYKGYEVGGMDVYRPAQDHSEHIENRKMNKYSSPVCQTFLSDSLEQTRMSVLPTLSSTDISYSF